jgi:heme/copper-type cytochrome/quinol oxidase subunit 2
MEKKLRLLSFAAHSARGLVRDQTTRRWAMFVTLLVAMLMIFAGSTFLSINPHEHPGWFIVFWLACAWLTVTALLLAVFDVVAVRSRSRAEERELEQRFHSQNRD